MGNNSELEEKIRELGPWYHNIELDGLETKVISPPPETPDWLMDHPKKRWEVVRRFLPENGGSAVDLGCNAGGISFELEERGYEVTGVELDDRLYEQALFAKDVLDSDVDFVQEDAVDFLEDSQVFDYSIALGLVYHLENPGRFIELLGEKTRRQLLVESKVERSLTRESEKLVNRGKVWDEERDIWLFSEDWLKERVKETGISKIFTATRGGSGLPVKGFRFLVTGRFE